MRKEFVASALRTVGPVLVSLGNFAAALALQLWDDPQRFGTYAFAMVLIAAWQALSSGVFGSALLMLFAQDPEPDSAALSSFAAANVLFVLVGCVAIPLACYGVSSAADIMFPVAVLTIGQTVRNYVRSCQIAAGQSRDAVYSDTVYGVVTTLGIGLLVALQQVSADLVVWLQALATLASVALASAWQQAIPRPGNLSLAPFWRSFQRYGRWAAIGVAATEFSSNAHSYLITFVLGPAAFAPIAAVTLLFRPVGVIALALTQFERPRLAREFAENRVEGVRGTVTNFHALLLVACALNIALVIAMFVFFPHAVVNADFDRTIIVWSIAGLSLLRIMQMLRMPTSAALQAAGAFQTLAGISVATIPLVALAALLPLLIFPHLPHLALFGALCGETVAVILTEKTYRKALAGVHR